MKIFQTCEKLSKITKISTKLSKEVNEIQNDFSKKLKKKNDLLKCKIHQKLKYFNSIFFLNSRYFLFHSRLSFVVRV